MTRLRTPWRASRAASVRPTGPPPAMRTGMPSGNGGDVATQAPVLRGRDCMRWRCRPPAGQELAAAWAVTTSAVFRQLAACGFQFPGAVLDVRAVRIGLRALGNAGTRTRPRNA